jgi:dUTP pyrophosphatase
MKIKIVNKSSNPLPKYATDGSAGLDLQANLIEGDKVVQYDPANNQHTHIVDDDTKVYLYPKERVLIPTGLFIELSIGYEAQIRPRSGLALKNGVTVANCIGTIDSDYRGEIKVILINLSDEPFIIRHGDRIAQMVISRYEQADFEEVETLSETERGTGGFGSTGVAQTPHQAQ